MVIYDASTRRTWGESKLAYSSLSQRQISRAQGCRLQLSSCSVNDLDQVKKEGLGIDSVIARIAAGKTYARHH